MNKTRKYRRQYRFSEDDYDIRIYWLEKEFKSVAGELRQVYHQSIVRFKDRILDDTDWMMPCTRKFLLEHCEGFLANHKSKYRISIKNWFNDDL